MSGASGKVFDVFRYPYDCHNIKYALKCFIRGRTLENTLAGMYDFATVSRSPFEAIQSEDYSALPKHMAGGGNLRADTAVCATKLSTSRLTAPSTPTCWSLPAKAE